jgi:CelD/BcsL family acetyltransferase involved in cellulose biosynthesis
LRVLVLREIPDDALLREQWDSLVQQMEQPQVFYTYEWAISVQRAYGPVLRPLLLLGYEQESLHGVAALAFKRNGELAFLADSTADYCDFLSSPDLRRHWCEAVLRELRTIHHGPLSLANLPADSKTASVLSAAAGGQGYRTFVRPSYRCARIVLRGDEDRASLKRSTAGKKAFRRKIRLLDQTGSAVFSANIAGQEIDQVVAEFCRAHVTRFISGGRLSNMIQPERRAFLRELGHQLSKRGWLSINRLLMGDRCVAWNYGFQFAGSWFWYQPTFDTNYQRFSPGLCLLGKVIEAACDSPEISVVDLGLGAEGYKERFANASRLTLHASLSLSPISHAKAVLRHRAAEVIKARPGAERHVRAAVDRLTHFQSCLQKEGFCSCVRLLATRFGRQLMGRQEVHFFQWSGNLVGVQAEGTAIRELDQEMLALAAIEYSTDKETLDYLARAGQRLQAGASRGFALVTSSPAPVHFCWVSAFEGFEMRELEQRLKAPSLKAVLIFDCWSPTSVRGRNYFATSITTVASRLGSSGEVPWIFAAAQNRASVNGIMKAGFDYKFTMRRRGLLGLTRTDETARKAVVSRTPIGDGLRDYAHSEN